VVGVGGVAATSAEGAAYLPRMAERFPFLAPDKIKDAAGKRPGGWLC
jgi:hypothetical protein